MFNFREITALYLANQAAVMVKDEEELSRKIRFFLANPLEADRLGRAGKELLSLNQGATERNLEAIKRGQVPFSLRRIQRKRDLTPFLQEMKKFLLEIAQDKRKDVLAVLLAPFLYLLSLLYGIIIRLACFSYCRGFFPAISQKSKSSA